MTTATLPAPTVADGQPDQVDHIYCCDEDIALCGADLTAVPLGPEFDLMCAMCVLAQDARRPCSVPGCRP